MFSKSINIIFLFTMCWLFQPITLQQPKWLIFSLLVGWLINPLKKHCLVHWLWTNYICKSGLNALPPPLLDNVWKKGWKDGLFKSGKVVSELWFCCQKSFFLAHLKLWGFVLDVLNIQHFIFLKLWGLALDSTFDIPIKMSVSDSWWRLYWRWVSWSLPAQPTTTG